MDVVRRLISPLSGTGRASSSNSSSGEGKVSQNNKSSQKVTKFAKADVKEKQIRQHPQGEVPTEQSGGVDRERFSSGSDELESAPSDRSFRPRELSNGSLQALKSLNKASYLVQGVEDEYAVLSKRVQAAVAELMDAKTKLAVLNGDIDKLQAKEIDSIVTEDLVSAKESSRKLRRDLNERMEKLSNQVSNAHYECSARLQIDAQKAFAERNRFIFE